MSQTIPLRLVRANPGQPRRHFDADRLAELAASVAADGLLQPITVRPDGDGYVIVAGERRWRAVTSLGWTEIEANVLHDVAEADAYMLSVTENVTRADMTAIEEARGYATLVAFGLTVEDVARRLGKRPADVRWRMDLLRLSDVAQDAVEAGHLPVALAWEVSGLSRSGQDVVLARWARGEFATVTEATVFARAVAARESQDVLFGEPDDAATTERRERARKVVADTTRQITGLLRAVDRLADVDDDDLVLGLGADAVRLRAMLDDAAGRIGRLRSRVRAAAARLDVEATLEGGGPDC